MNRPFEIRVLNKAPSMNETVAQLVDGPYADAVAAARRVFAECGRRTAVVRDAYYWFFIRPDGSELDRNVVGGSL